MDLSKIVMLPRARAPGRPEIDSPLHRSWDLATPQTMQRHAAQGTLRTGEPYITDTDPTAGRQYLNDNVPAPQPAA